MGERHRLLVLLRHLLNSDYVYGCDSGQERREAREKMPLENCTSTSMWVMLLEYRTGLTTNDLESIESMLKPAF